MIAEHALKQPHRDGCQVTMLMVLPPKVDLAAAAHLMQNGSSAPSSATFQHTQGGAGFARLATQLITYCLGLSWVWFLDDNIKEVSCLDYEALLSAPDRRAELQEAPFSKVMMALQEVVKQPDNSHDA